MFQNERELKKILARLESIERKITNSNKLDGYISEYDAKKRFKKGTTWFWNLRQGGFPYTKFGGEVFYAVEDIVSYFESNRIGGFDD